MSAALTRAALLDAARTLFVTKGFDATSIEDIAQLAQASKGAVYHHFSDKQEIFAEVFRSSQAVVIQAAIESMSGSGQPWDLVEAATQAFLRSYVADEDARALLRQVTGVLGWDRVRALDEEAALPFLRATLEESVRTGQVRPTPIEATAELLFSLYCNAILFIAGVPDAARASSDVETVILFMLAGLKPTPPAAPLRP
jgi:AcrR family transcriptional regulator